MTSVSLHSQRVWILFSCRTWRRWLQLQLQPRVLPAQHQPVHSLQTVEPSGLWPVQVWVLFSPVFIFGWTGWLCFCLVSSYILNDTFFVLFLMKSAIQKILQVFGSFIYENFFFFLSRIDELPCFWQLAQQQGPALPWTLWHLSVHYRV